MNVLDIVERMVNKKMEEEKMNLRREIEKELAEMNSHRSVQMECNSNKEKSCEAKNKHATLVQTKVLSSPSDTTIYAPAFAKLPPQVSGKELIINQISNFVDKMRIQHDAEASTSGGGGSG